MKIDLKKQHSTLYAPKNIIWEEVTVPSMSFLMIDGAGDPNVSSEYANAVAALYGLSYTLKFMSKKELDKDYVVMPLEGLWYANDMNVFEKRDKSLFQWTMMIMQPEWITRSMLVKAQTTLLKKKSEPLIENVRFEIYGEGLSLQLLHRGSYDDESSKLYELHHALMPERGLDFNGHHHEIYLSDPRKVSPEKLKTVLRQPIKKRS